MIFMTRTNLKYRLRQLKGLAISQQSLWTGKNDEFCVDQKSAQSCPWDLAWDLENFALSSLH